MDFGSHQPVWEAMEGSHICFSTNQCLPDIKTSFSGVVDMVNCLPNIHSIPLPLCCVGGINICGGVGWQTTKDPCSLPQCGVHAGKQMLNQDSVSHLTFLLAW